MESLVRVIFTGLNKQLREQQECCHDFETIDTRLREQTDNTIEQSDRLEGRLSVDNLESKIIDFESLIKKLDQIKNKIDSAIDVHKVKKVCDVSYDTVTRACFYGFGAIAATITAFNDITDDLIGENGVPTWFKVYRSASGVLVLPFIYGVEENLKKKEALRADRVELKGDIDERLYSAEVFLNFLVHRKEALAVKKGSQSPENDDRLADLLEGAALFRGIRNADAHQRELISFAQRRISQAPDSPGSRLKSVLERTLSDESLEEQPRLKLDFRQSALLLMRGSSKRGSRRTLTSEGVKPVGNTGDGRSTMGYSQTARAVRESHRGSSDERGMITISLED